MYDKLLASFINAYILSRELGLGSRDARSPARLVQVLQDFSQVLSQL